MCIEISHIRVLLGCGKYDDCGRNSVKWACIEQTALQIVSNCPTDNRLWHNLYTMWSVFDSVRCRYGNNPKAVYKRTITHELNGLSGMLQTDFCASKIAGVLMGQDGFEPSACSV